MVYRIIIETAQKNENNITLTFEQNHYLKNVVRLKQEDQFIAIDSHNTYLVKLIGNKGQIIQILEEDTELPITITLMIALPKGNSFDEVIRSCTELGVNRFVPVISQRTILKPSNHKIERWRKIAKEATEQSERQIVPIISDPVPFSEALGSIETKNNNRYICVTRKKAKHLLTHLSQQTTHSITIATGCEGGWSEPEIETAIAWGFIPVSLGSRVLRAVTSPIVALSLVAAVVEQKN
ncbi:MAG: 16S rRNA (uracil(1498)-N(3))-methyltransferase [Crocosphaera sp.]|nr:16S rRNA (uracil(1498)-N(3))-methyltransferase [Crocosphaera sp.]